MNASNWLLAPAAKTAVCGWDVTAYKSTEVGRICTVNELPASLLQHITPAAPTAKPYPRWSTVTPYSGLSVQLHQHTQAAI